MARLRGPLFSFGASGTVAGLLNIQPRAAGAVARRKPDTATPPTLAQAFYRTEFATAAETWRAATPETRQEWTEYAARHARPPFAAYWLEWMAQHSTPSAPPYVPQLPATGP